ncbi:hypothetical protein DMN91_001656 [Ooceraea biroi]|uniref:THAP-type domain-containing protein n=1 Tax=Ooceraea biroi TaxID=2015173 RepID=A0A3L8DYF6_OOCBI|nr:uncharacterized protein LOC105284598 [Ooceraea biroi]RLU25500.1 hypothetical protein DMN91_001656 [Ooceraea biroi]
MVNCCICWKEHCSLLPRKCHSFPTNTERREKWFHSIGYTVNAYKNAKICSDHFTEDDYNYTGTSVQSKRLKKTAIPSVLIQRNIKRDSGSNIQTDS